MTRDQRRLHDPFGLKATSESAADQIAVDRHLILAKAKRLGDLDPRASRDLTADPDFAGAIAYFDSAVERFHCCMRQHRHAIVGFKDGRGLRERLCDITLGRSGDALAIKRRINLLDQVCSRQARQSALPTRIEHGETFARGACMPTDHCEGI